MPDDDAKIPTQPGAPTSEHGQMMYVLGQIVGTQKAIIARQDVANGRTTKNEERIGKVETKQSLSDGASITWTKIGAFLTILIAAIALIVKLIK
jgi:hypothetical protein